MKSTSLTEMSTDELIKNKRTTSIITGSLAGMLIILFAQSIYTWSIEGFTNSVIIPLALSPIVFSNLKKIKEVKRELEMRRKDLAR